MDYIVSIEQVKNTAKDVKDIDAAAVRDITKNVFDISEKVDNAWTGNDALEFTKNLRKYKVDMDILVGCMELLGGTLNQVATKMQESLAGRVQEVNRKLGGNGVVESVTLEYQNTVDPFSADYVPGTIFQAQSYENLSESEVIQLKALVAGEDGGSYEGALAVVSTILNRCESSDWKSRGGANPYAQATASKQFAAWEGNLTPKYLENPSTIPDYVDRAVEDALNGVRNHNYTCFRASTNQAEGRVQIGDNGNWYFQEKVDYA